MKDQTHRVILGDKLPAATFATSCSAGNLRKLSLFCVPEMRKETASLLKLSANDEQDENSNNIHREAEGSTKASTFEVVTEMPLVLRRQFRAISSLLTAACDGILTPALCLSSLFFVWRRNSSSPESHSKIELNSSLN
ncbi:unnamed protein product [Clavelina lepadiformis]|uniref:Uncharacterized protein n=1 Tax=Clavelina lepadiformis TaxID=159417 RepID=A0ABP0G6U4_CLALP